MAKGHKLPRGSVGGMPSPRKFLKNGYAPRCNLVHFERQSCPIVSLDREYLLYVH